MVDFSVNVLYSMKRVLLGCPLLSISPDIVDLRSSFLRFMLILSFRTFLKLQMGNQDL